MTSPELSPAEADRRIAVLVVDDDTRVRAALRATIQHEPDLELIGDVPGAPAALALALEAAPFVALVDVVVHADGSGLALVQMLSQVRGCRVVAMSVRRGYSAASRAAGAVSFVEKGDDVDALLTAVRAAAGPSVQS